MVNPFTTLLTLEGALAVMFFAVVLWLYRKVDAADASLWVLAWATRVFASLEGVRHLAAGSQEMGMYMGLQACSACALMVVLARSELRVLKERVVKRLMLRLGGARPAVSESEFG